MAVTSPEGYTLLSSPPEWTLDTPVPFRVLVQPVTSLCTSPSVPPASPRCSGGAGWAPGLGWPGPQEAGPGAPPALPQAHTRLWPWLGRHSPPLEGASSSSFDLSAPALKTVLCGLWVSQLLSGLPALPVMFPLAQHWAMMRRDLQGRESAPGAAATSACATSTPRASTQGPLPKAGAAGALPLAISKWTRRG